ncbi:MAG: glycosyltransferase family 61 protein [Cyanobacteria bacterium CRU_2_1]|nr:glycosyltransferase family 61 protein [Cyanobacteria bacterium CRU_2_1]
MLPFLIDDLPRLYHLHQPRYADREINLLISRPLTEVEEFLLPKLLPENVKILPIAQDTNYLAENYIFLSFLTGYGGLPSEYLKFFVNRVCPNRERKRSNRIYISRQKSSKGRRVLNEDKLFDALSRYGFVKYTLEDMSIEEQINLFYDSEYVIAPHGGGVANILFAEKINLMELFPSQFVWSPVYYFLSKSMNHTYYYWCGGKDLDYVNFKTNLSEKGMTSGTYFKDRNFVVDVSEVLSLLERSLDGEKFTGDVDHY